MIEPKINCYDTEGNFILRTVQEKSVASRKSKRKRKICDLCDLISLSLSLSLVSHRIYPVSNVH